MPRNGYRIHGVPADMSHSALKHGGSLFHVRGSGAEDLFHLNG
jgi:hypothetical protein